MSYVVKKKTRENLKVSVTFDGSVVEARCTQVVRDMQDRAFSAGECGLFSNASLLQRHPGFQAALRSVLQDLFYEGLGKLLAQEHVVMAGTPAVQLVSADFSGLFEVAADITIVPELEKIEYRDLNVRYHPVVLSGTEVDDRIRDVCEQFNVANEQDLIEVSGLYPSVENMRESLAASLDDFVEQVNDKALSDAVRHALLSKNRFEVPTDMLDACVEDEFRRVSCQLGAETLAGCLEQSGQSVESFKQTMRDQVGDIPRLEIILDAIVPLLPEGRESISDAERLAHIDQQRLQSLNPSDEEPSDAVLERMRKQPDVVRSLDHSIMRNRALAWVRAQSSPKKLSPVTVEEYMKLQKGVMPMS